MDTCIGGGTDEWMDKMNYRFPHASRTPAEASTWHGALSDFHPENVRKPLTVTTVQGPRIITFKILPLPWSLPFYITPARGATSLSSPGVRGT
ncbi:E3 Ubiquitin-Protein Ligase Siah1 [Manis pentadactyla]|nr:E3 Ubiquitin-Protein Ligase Siah1 [Manis pentadactyla]